MNEYKIKEAAALTCTPASTLRYYDKQQLIPVLKRDCNGNRLYTDTDIAWIQLINCLKNSGMPLKEIKHFMDLCLQGTKTSLERKNLLLQHKKSIENQICQLKCSLDVINYKIEHYNEIGIFHIDCKK